MAPKTTLLRSIIKHRTLFNPCKMAAPLVAANGGFFNGTSIWLNFLHEYKVFEYHRAQQMEQILRLLRVGYIDETGLCSPANGFPLRVLDVSVINKLFEV